MKLIFFFKQRTAYEMRIIDWNSDVCSSDLRTAGDLRQHDAFLALRGRAGVARPRRRPPLPAHGRVSGMSVRNLPITMIGALAGLLIWAAHFLLIYGFAALACARGFADVSQIGRASCRERVGPGGEISVVAVSLKKK